MLGTYALSAGYYDAYYLKAQKVRTLIKGDFDAFWAQGFDALVAPTSPTVAFRFGARLEDPVAMYLSDACTLPVNMAGLAGISIPAGLSEGLPVGPPVHRRPWSEPALFELGPRLRGASRRRPTGAAVEPTDLPPWTTHRRRRRPSGWPPWRWSTGSPFGRVGSGRRPSSTMPSVLIPAAPSRPPNRHSRGIPWSRPSPSCSCPGSSSPSSARVGPWPSCASRAASSPTTAAAPSRSPLHERSDVATLAWLAVSLYGLILATAGVLFGR